MQFLKRVVITLLLLLLLSFVKNAVDQSATVQRDFLRNLIANIQLLLLLSVMFVSLLQWAFQKMTSRRLSSLKALLAFTGLLAISELATFYALRHPQVLPASLLRACREYYGNYGRQQTEFDPACARYDSSLTYTLRQNASFSFNNFEFKTTYTTNAAGLRDDNPSLIKPEIICLGDSYTMGWGVQQSETFPALLEQSTGRKVLNAGISSYGTAREMLSLQRFDLSNLQYLIIQYCANDITENNAFLEHKGKLPVMSAFKYDSLCKALQHRLRYYPFKHFLSTSRFWAQQLFRGSAPALNINVPDKSDQQFRQQTRQFLSVLRLSLPLRDSIKIIVFDATGEPPMEQGFVAALRQQLLSDTLHTISVVDIAPGIKIKDCFLLDGHLNAAGHAVVARLLGSEIKTGTNP